MTSEYPTRSEAPGQLRAAPSSTLLPLAVCLLFMQVLVACKDGPGSVVQDPVPPLPPPAPRPVTEPPPSTPWLGFFVGGATADDGVSFLVEALLTANGEIRMSIIGPQGWGGPTGAIPSGISNPQKSLQFVGSFTVTDRKLAGLGTLYGQACTGAGDWRFCGHPAAATIAAGIAGEDILSGEMRLATEAGEEIWSLELHEYQNGFDYRETLDSLAGTYREELTDFAQDGDVVINVGTDGVLFFQSPGAGCVGNGILLPRADKDVNTFDITLTIANCSAAFEHLNNAYEGLARFTLQSWWDSYDSDWLVVWVSTPVGAMRPAAVTMWGDAYF